MPLEEFGVAGEPTVASCLAEGPDLVAFSADKLLCGPQAGLVVGRADLIAALAAHPVARAVRPDKMTLAALAATLQAWKRGSWRDFPVYRAAARSLEELEGRAAALAAAAAGNRALTVAVEGVRGAVRRRDQSRKSGSPRGRSSLAHDRLGAEDLAARLRSRRPPIIGRVEGARLWLDLRAVAPEEDEELGAALSELR